MQDMMSDVPFLKAVSQNDQNVEATLKPPSTGTGNPSTTGTRGAQKVSWRSSLLAFGERHGKEKPETSETEGKNPLVALHSLTRHPMARCSNYSTSCDPHHDMSGRIFGHIFSIF